MTTAKTTIQPTEGSRGGVESPGKGSRGGVASPGKDVEDVAVEIAPTHVRDCCVDFGNRLSMVMGRSGCSSLLSHVAIAQALLAGMTREEFDRLVNYLWQSTEVDLHLAGRIQARGMAPGGEA